MSATTEAGELQSKPVVIVVMTIAIAADVTQNQAAWMRVIVWELAMEVAMPNGVAKRPLRRLQLRQFRLQHHHPPGRLQAQGSKGMAKMWFFMVSEQLVQSTCFVGWACNALCITTFLIRPTSSALTKAR